jgi:hypothetical protein
MASAVQEEQKPYVVVPLPVRDRIYRRMVYAEAEVVRLTEDLRLCKAELGGAENMLENAQRVIAVCREVLRAG